ncbi:MAG TPA: hypothetical protein PLP88_01025, partial [Bacteroidales bacterium]|nr:hypothetical protein [Bacteroidales bacterium]
MSGEVETLLQKECQRAGNTKIKVCQSFLSGPTHSKVHALNKVTVRATCSIFTKMLLIECMKPEFWV